MAAGAATSRPSPPGRRFFSRLRRSPPFSSRSRSLTDFYVRPEDPHRQYSPSDLVKGAVVLTVSKPIRVTHLVVALGGYVRVFKNGAPSENISSSSLVHAGRGRRDGEYFGNGFASLFQDEVVLCGDGKLDAGVYEFNFELEFPSRGLPSSIDFERGTVSYLITASMTRPTTISPVTTCSRKVQLVETVDVGPLRPPKPRLITLEPIVRRTKAKTDSKRTSVVRSKSTDSKATTSEGAASGRAPSSPAGSDAASVNTSGDGPAPPQSPALSEGSEESRATASTGSFMVGSVPSVSRSAKKTFGIGDNTFEKKTITATIELLRGGCLRGESLPVKISVNHNKRIKSLYGIVITLYRQARIDSHPVLPIGPTGKNATESSKHEDYYPKSKTGLGGLSLSSAGSSHTFRKDLSQTFAPLIIDPRTLTAVVKSSVRVPEEAFPSISSVPGAMISFRYYVEVVVDLGGKVSGQERFLPRLDSAEAPLAANRAEEQLDGVLAARTGNVMETDQLRREKGVVASVFEVLVGSTDSARGRKTETNSGPGSERLDPYSRRSTPPSQVPEEGAVLDGPSNPEPPVQGPQNYDIPYEYDPTFNRPHHGDVAPPDIPEEEELDEKGRLRQAEERLLPSQPPAEEPASSSAQEIAPSAPVLDGPELGRPEHIEPPLQPGQILASHQDISDIPPASEDKQELERRRLAEEASAPSDFPDEDAGPGFSDTRLPPSAPILPDGDEGRYADDHDAHRAILGTDGSSHDNLPQYER
ncbi:MAG: hypothetical protein M4579_003783 [Chaenotheca gracillima]|nr:MAG: hypothetical protein M4579_003783 [Chaenotheca gracillima]